VSAAQQLAFVAGGWEGGLAVETQYTQAMKMPKTSGAHRKRSARCVRQPPKNAGLNRNKKHHRQLENSFIHNVGFSNHHKYNLRKRRLFAVTPISTVIDRTR
jgi:hypothetical protein